MTYGIVEDIVNDSDGITSKEVALRKHYIYYPIDYYETEDNL